MIKLEHVDKYFGDLHVLKDVNLEVAEGEKLVIIRSEEHTSELQSQR